ncbi:hypothetical protein XBLMG947_1712 [Xanthomonas bromi]|uniref:Uncharacterized protein n=1 Tax=Xanthomonas bromi TaxID=56449 RepID=A0A1C3NKK3_9XANT|nr:hypothetical protein XbrCFBP1976_07480 [Xanthomonas bromi]SBV50929.1 hypothetical protein XBLMG947_1712 [Xanthomonas bromi]
MQFVNSVGWLASVTLIATLIRQTYKPSCSDAAHGVSRWLFLCQVSASVLLIVYNYFVGNMVFIVSNALILLPINTGYEMQRFKCRKLECAAWMCGVDNACRLVEIVSFSFSKVSAVSPMQLPPSSQRSS